MEQANRVKTLSDALRADGMSDEQIEAIGATEAAAQRTRERDAERLAELGACVRRSALALLKVAAANANANRTIGYIGVMLPAAALAAQASIELYEETMGKGTFKECASWQDQDADKSTDSYRALSAAQALCELTDLLKCASKTPTAPAQILSQAASRAVTAGALSADEFGELLDEITQSTEAATCVLADCISDKINAIVTAGAGVLSIGSTPTTDSFQARNLSLVLIGTATAKVMREQPELLNSKVPEFSKAVAAKLRSLEIAGIK